MKKVRWGLIGAGRIAQTFARDISGLENAELTAVAARDGGRAKEFARLHSVARAHAGYEALYADPDVDAIYIATPHSHHLQQCKDSLTAGKAVLCEKPLVLNPSECEALIKHAHQARIYVMEGLWTWFLPAIRKAQEWVAAGRIGTLLHVKADFGYPFPYRDDLREYDASLGGGAVLEMGIYPVAIAKLFLPGEPQSVQVVARTAPNGVEDDVSAIFDYGYAMATLGTSFRCKLPNRAYIIGTEGYVVIPDFWAADACSLFSGDERIDHFEDKRTTGGFDYQIAEVSSDILAGKTESDTIPLSTSLALQRDMAKIRTLALQTPS